MAKNNVGLVSFRMSRDLFQQRGRFTHAEVYRLGLDSITQAKTTHEQIRSALAVLVTEGLPVTMSRCEGVAAVFKVSGRTVYRQWEGMRDEQQTG